jgi:hypothetical protein
MKKIAYKSTKILEPVYNEVNDILNEFSAHAGRDFTLSETIKKLVDSYREHHPKSSK